MMAAGRIVRPTAQRCFRTFQGMKNQAFSSNVDQEYGWGEDARPLTESEKKALVQQMIRANVLSEIAAAKLVSGQRCNQQTRPDFVMRQERENELLRRIEDISRVHRVRPSLLRPLMAAVGFSLGAASGVFNKQASTAISGLETSKKLPKALVPSGAIQDVLTEQYNDQLREMREAGLSDLLPEVRDIVREMRDEERAPADAVQAPDLLKMQKPQELAPAEILAGVVKYGLKGLLSVGSKI